MVVTVGLLRQPACFDGDACRAGSGRFSTTRRRIEFLMVTRILPITHGYPILFPGSWGTGGGDTGTQPVALDSRSSLFGVALLLRLAIAGMRRGNSAIPEWAYYVLVSSAISGLLLSVSCCPSRHRALRLSCSQCFFWCWHGYLTGGIFAAAFGLRIGANCWLLRRDLFAGHGDATCLLGAAGPHYTLVTRRGVVNTPTKDKVIGTCSGPCRPRGTNSGVSVWADSSII